MLKRTVSTEEYNELAEGLREFYVETDDGYRLDVEVDPEIARKDAKIKEMRDNNIRLMKERDDKKPKVEDVGVAEQLAEMRSQMKEVTDKLAASEKREKDALSRANRADFTTKLREVGNKHGLIPAAVDDMQRRAEAAGFRMEEGNAVAKNEAGEVITDSTGSPLTLTGWLADQKGNGAEHLFAKPRGTDDGSGRGTPAAGSVVTNPSAEWMRANYKDVAKGKKTPQFSGAAAE